MTQPDTTNWRERFDKELEATFHDIEYIDGKAIFVPPASKGLRDWAHGFIQTLLTEQARAIIDEIPDGFYNCRKCGLSTLNKIQNWCFCTDPDTSPKSPPDWISLKQQLKSKFNV